MHCHHALSMVNLLVCSILSITGKCFASMHHSEIGPMKRITKVGGPALNSVDMSTFTNGRINIPFDFAHNMIECTSNLCLCIVGIVVAASSIPHRCFYSKQINNLLCIDFCIAGLDI
eukprot:scaffold37078_cov117-Cyclotella_meneghiniana.AAC.6